MLKGLRVPHTLVLLFAMMVLALVGTWLLPQGKFETVQDARGHALVVPGTYAPVDERALLPPTVLVTVLPRAMAAAQDIIFFVLLAGGATAAAVGMLLIQTLPNFFISSGSGQAFVTIPIRRRWATWSGSAARPRCWPTSLATASRT